MMALRRGRQRRLLASSLEHQLQDLSLFDAETEEAESLLKEWFESREGPVLALTGAGVSTGSGIPDYRGVNGSYRVGHKPMKHDEFMSNEFNRQRYWARSLVGFPASAAAKPNGAHRALAHLQERGLVSLVATQNVDGLHEKSTAELGRADEVVALHGRGDRVVCMSCGTVSCRLAYHEKLESLNPDFVGEAKDIRPDADAEIDVDSQTLKKFSVAPCSECGGLIKPDVVFFGDSVPKTRVDACFAALEKADGILCLGTSLAVFSAFRFVDRAHKTQKDICVVNKGPTRAELANIPHTKINANVDIISF